MMRTVDKSGIHIELCEGCRGVFLDRGELEQIVGAENSYYGDQAVPPPYPGGQPAGYARADSPRPYRGGHGDSPKPYRGGYGDSPKPYRGGHGDSPSPYGHGGRRKRSFLENLFD